MNAALKPDAPIELASEPDFMLGALTVRPCSSEVVIDGVRRRLEPRVMQTLVALAQANGAVVSRAEEGRRVEPGAAGEAHVTRARLIVNDAWRRVRRQLGRLREYPDNDLRVVAAEVLASSGAYLPGRRPAE